MQPVYLLLALLCVAVDHRHRRLVAALLARVFEPHIERRPVVCTALESHLIGGATSFGGFEIPYQIVMLRRGGLTGSQAMSVVIFKGLVHTLLLAIVALVSLLPWTDSPITSLQRWLLLGATGALLLVWVVVWLWLRRPLGRAFVPKRLHGKLDELVEAARAFGGASRRTIAELVALQTRLLDRHVRHPDLRAARAGLARLHRAHHHGPGGDAGAHAALAAARRRRRGRAQLPGADRALHAREHPRFQSRAVALSSRGSSRSASGRSRSA